MPWAWLSLCPSTLSVLCRRHLHTGGLPLTVWPQPRSLTLLGTRFPNMDSTASRSCHGETWVKACLTEGGRRECGAQGRVREPVFHGSTRERLYVITGLFLMAK